MVLQSKKFYQTLIKFFFCEMGLFTLHNCCVSWLLNFLKLKLDSQSRLTIPEFSGYHCTHYNFLQTREKRNPSKLCSINLIDELNISMFLFWKFDSFIQFQIFLKKTKKYIISIKILKNVLKGKSLFQLLDEL